MSAILSDETAVEHIQKKGPYRQKKPAMTLLAEVFGRGKCKGAVSAEKNSYDSTS